MLDEALIESLLYVRGEEGITLKQLNQFTTCTEEQLEQWMLELVKDDKRGIQLKKYGNRYKFVTKKQFSEQVEQLATDRTVSSLSQAALEVLAIIAYKQPITRVEVDDIRGVSSDGPLQRLIQRELVGEQGRLDQIGRPILYGTTDLFLEQFGLESLEKLPPLPTREDDREETDLFMSQFKEAFS